MYNPEKCNPLPRRLLIVTTKFFIHFVLDFFTILVYTSPVNQNQYITMTQDQIFDILYKHELWLEEKEGGERADLHNADLRDTDLHMAVLFEVNLEGANLQRANLEGADLRWANLRNANLGLADLREADLQGADLTGASLQEADLRKTHFRGAKMLQQTMDEACLNFGQRDSIFIIK